MSANVTRASRNGNGDRRGRVVELVARSDLLFVLAEALRDRRCDPDDGGAGHGGGSPAGGIRLRPLSLGTDDDWHGLLSAARLDEETRSHLAAFRAAAAELPEDVRAWEEARLFDAAGVCLPNETAYIRRDKGAILADVMAFYRAFGLELSPELAEKADHIGVEVEFVGSLLLWLARAVESGNEEGAEVTRHALESFLRDHLCEWLPLFTERLRGTSVLLLYRSLAGALGALVDEVVRGEGLDVDPSVPAAAGSTTTGTTRADDEETPYECGWAGPTADEPGYGGSS